MYHIGECEEGERERIRRGVAGGGKWSESQSQESFRSMVEWGGCILWRRGGNGDCKPVLMPWRTMCHSFLTVVKRKGRVDDTKVGTRYFINLLFPLRTLARLINLNFSQRIANCFLHYHSDSWHQNVPSKTLAVFRSTRIYISRTKEMKMMLKLVRVMHAFRVAKITPNVEVSARRAWFLVYLLKLNKSWAI